MPADTATTADPKGGRGSLRLILAFLLVVGAGIALAWVGAGSLRPEVTDTGLEFRTMKAGTGDPIAPADAALLDYVLTSDDGKVVDSSESHGGAQPFSADQVFPGFAEAMGKMSEGGEYRFSMPQSLAFVGTPPPPDFPKDSRLNFDVRVQKIVRGGAALLRQQQMQQQQGMSEPPPAERR